MKITNIMKYYAIFYTIGDSEPIYDSITEHADIAEEKKYTLSNKLFNCDVDFSIVISEINL